MLELKLRQGKLIYAYLLPTISTKDFTRKLRNMESKKVIDKSAGCCRAKERAFSYPNFQELN